MIRSVEKGPDDCSNNEVPDQAVRISPFQSHIPHDLKFAGNKERDHTNIYYRLVWVLFVNTWQK